MELAICQLLYAASDEASVVTLNDRKMIMVSPSSSSETALCWLCNLPLTLLCHSACACYSG